MTETTLASGGDTPGTTSSFIGWLRQLQSLALLPVIVVVLIVGSMVHPNFFTQANLIGNVLSLSAPLGVLVIAESIILIGGYFDLSLQSTTGLAPMLLVVFLSTGELNPGLGWSPWLAWLAMFAIVILIGLFNALLVAKFQLNAFIVTLAVLILLQGITLGVSSGHTYTNVPAFIKHIGRGNFVGIPLQGWVLIVAFVIAYVIMTYHPVGRSVYAAGGNAQAARAAGIRTTRVTVGLFVVGSLLSVVAGLLLTAQTAAVTPTLGNNIIFTVFAAAVLGGISLDGGRGSLIGAALGVLLLGLIQNILTLSDVPSFWINAAYGGIIIIALVIGRGSMLMRFIRKAFRSEVTAAEGVAGQVTQS